MSIDGLADKIALKTASVLNLDTAQKDVIKYGYNVIFINIFGVAGVLIIAFFLNILIPTLAVTAALILMRPYAGGAHCNSPLNCNLFGLLFMPVLGYAVILLTGLPLQLSITYLLLSTSVAIAGIHVNAPYFTQVKPRASMRYMVLKRRSFLVAGLVSLASYFLYALNYEIWSIGLATGLLWQGVMLLPTGIRIVHTLDSLLSRIISREGGERA